MGFRERFIKHLRAGSAFASTVQESVDLEDHSKKTPIVSSETGALKASKKIFREGFKNFLLGEGPSVSKTLATYLIAPLFVAVYPLSKFTELLTFHIHKRSQDQSNSLGNLVKSLLLVLSVAPMAMPLLVLSYVAKVARAVLRVALTPVAEVFNFGFAAIQALRGDLIPLLSDQKLSLLQAQILVGIFFRTRETRAYNETSPILRSTTMDSVALPVWTLGISLLVEYLREWKKSHKSKGTEASQKTLPQVTGVMDDGWLRQRQRQQHSPTFQIRTFEIRTVQSSQQQHSAGYGSPSLPTPPTSSTHLFL